MKRLLSTVFLMICTTTSIFAGEDRPNIFIPPTGDGFEVYIAAAIAKKNVPAHVVTAADSTALTLKAAQVQVQKESTRMKLAKCVLQSCMGTEDKASTSVQLLDCHGSVVWSYAVESDDASKKDMAETIAKRLKKEYFHQ
jgi:hypothetical protein